MGDEHGLINHLSATNEQMLGWMPEQDEHSTMTYWLGGVQFMPRCRALFVHSNVSTE